MINSVDTIMLTDLPFEDIQLHTLSGGLKMYSVVVHLLFDGTRIFAFSSRHDLFDNVALMKDLYVPYQTSIMRLYITRNNFPNLFKQIEEYVSVTRSD